MNEVQLRIGSRSLPRTSPWRQQEKGLTVSRNSRVSPASRLGSKQQDAHQIRAELAPNSSRTRAGLAPNTKLHTKLHTLHYDQCSIHFESSNIEWAEAI